MLATFRCFTTKIHRRPEANDGEYIKFAEHPGPTNVNRQFATSGSSCGFVDNTDQAAGWYNNVTGTTCATSIFEALTKKNISWKNVRIANNRV